MGSKVLLISVNRCADPDPVFPLGLTHLNAALRTAGFETCWLDCQIDSPQQTEEVLAGFRPDFVGISLRNIDNVILRKPEIYFGELASLCQSIRRQADCPIILGGSGFSIFPEKLLRQTQADWGICGEGEASLLALLQALTDGGQYRDIPGLVYRHENRIIVNAQRPAPSCPSPGAADRPPRLVAHYLKTSGMLNLQTQRGCSFGCCYCTYPLIEGRQARRRPAEEVAAELEQVERQGARYVFLVDSVFNSTPAHVVDICEAVIRRKLELRWGCFLRPQGLTPELMKLMARAGLSHIEFGSDSFCDAVLQSYQKGLTFDDILQSSELARREHLDFCHFLICGGPGETWQTLQEGFDNSRRLPGGVVMAVVGMRIYPGTPLFQRAVQEGLIRDGDDLLQPVYYVSPGLDPDAVAERLREFARLSPNWLVGEPTPSFASLVERLRRRNVVGPLWSYFSMLQRLWPQPSA